MKKLLLVAFAAAGLASCSDDDNSNPAGNEMIIQRVEKFTPSEDAYNAGIYPAQKHVQYFQGSHIVADTLFNYQGEIEQLATHTYNGNVHTQEIATPTVVTRVIEETYDSQGRVTEQKTTFTNSFANGYTPFVIKSFTYGNGTVTRQQMVGDTTNGSEPPTGSFTYVTNANGYIYGGIVNGAVETSTSFSGDQPTQNGIYNFSYYNTPMPQNMKPTVTQTNNAVLLQEYLNKAAENCRYYLQSYDGFVTFESQFNSLNYVTHTKATGTLPNEDVYDSETFYYYN